MLSRLYRSRSRQMCSLPRNIRFLPPSFLQKLSMLVPDFPRLGHRRGLPMPREWLESKMRRIIWFHREWNSPQGPVPTIWRPEASWLYAIRATTSTRLMPWLMRLRDRLPHRSRSQPSLLKSIRITSRSLALTGSLVLSKLAEAVFMVAEEEMRRELPVPIIPLATPWATEL